MSCKPSKEANLLSQVAQKRCFLAFLLAANLGWGKGLDGIEFSLTPGNTNTISLQTMATSSDTWLIFESSDSLIDDRVQVFYPTGYEIQSGPLPTGWVFQNGEVTPEQNAATWFYQGSGPESSVEFYSLDAGLTLTFQMAGPEPNENVDVELRAKTSVLLDGESLFVAALLNESDQATLFVDPLAAFREQFNLSIDGADDFDDDSGDGVPNLFYYAFGLNNPSLPVADRSNLPKSSPDNTGSKLTFVRRSDGFSDGISYILETSSDLSYWSEITSSPDQIELIDAIFERVTYRFSGDEMSAFYRVGIKRDD